MSQAQTSGTPTYDVLIVGGGLVGGSLACALSQVSLKVAVIEAGSLARDQPPSYDDRAIALSYGSMRILDAIGIWPLLSADSTPIRRIHVSDRGHFGFARLNAVDHGVNAFGFVTDARRLAVAVHQRLSDSEEIALYGFSKVQSVKIDNNTVNTVVRDATGDTELTARLLVAADGGGSPVRDLVGVAAERRDYAQHAITANVTPSQDHAGVAYERFTSSGPVALLPMSQRRCGLIWTVGEQDSAELMSVSDAEFLRRLQTTFGRRLGEFKRCGGRTEYPLAYIASKEQVRARLAVVGNAAHTLHPVAGQGLNLGLRDVSALAQVVVDAVRGGEDPGDKTVLQRYLQWRRGDHRSITRFTDLVVRVFASTIPPVVAGRNLGLVALDRVPLLKNALVARAMGLSGRQSRLARGLAL